jgi:hypothetical protein
MNESTRSRVEHSFGPQPSGSHEAFSLWLAALSPLTDRSKYDLLVSRNTAYRYEQCVLALRETAARRERRAALISQATSLASTAATFTASGFAALASYVMGSADDHFNSSNIDNEQDNDSRDGSFHDATTGDGAPGDLEEGEGAERGQFHGETDEDLRRLILQAEAATGEGGEDDEYQDVEFSPAVMVETETSSPPASLEAESNVDSTMTGAIEGLSMHGADDGSFLSTPHVGESQQVDAVNDRQEEEETYIDIQLCSDESLTEGIYKGE